MRSFSFILSLLFLTSVSAQEIQMSETASLEQIYGEVQEAEELLPMNELGIEFGYALYVMFLNRSRKKRMRELLLLTLRRLLRRNCVLI